MPDLNRKPLGWRWIAAAALFLCAFIGLIAGVPLSERPDVVTDSWLTKAYYALGLFVVGGLDVGTPAGGPQWARTLLWIAYFGAPLLTASAVIEAVVQVLSPTRWQLRNLKNHVIVFGSGSLTTSYLRLLVRQSPRTRVVVVDTAFSDVRAQELRQKFRAATVVGDITHEYLLQLLRVRKARRVVLFGENDFQSFEAAARILEIAPKLQGKVMIRCHNLRFMRAMQDTELAGRCEIFNTYNLAARGFVHHSLIDHFKRTRAKDTIVMAGFGRFGQSVWEELHAVARQEIKQIAVVDKDADRRVMVVDEQQQMSGDYPRTVFQGDISHPEVWRRVTAQIDLARDAPTIVLGTGQEQDNLRTALWIKQQFPNAQVYARTSDLSRFALAVGAEHGIKSVSITQLVEDNIPERWLD